MKTNSLISQGLFKSGLRRYWPLWLVLFVMLILNLDAPIYFAAVEIAGRTDGLAEKVQSMQSLWYTARMGSLVYALVASIVVAAALDDHLFDSRSATFVGSLPLRRTTIFATEFLLGLVALLAVFGLACICLLPLRVVVGSIFSLADLCIWYAITAALTLVLYAFAQLACHLSGTRPVAILLYGVLNFLVICLETAVGLAISSLQYGMVHSDWITEWMSPIIRLGEAVLYGVGDSSSPQWGTIALYVVVALVVAVGTNALFARRNLEAAGESVAYPVLRPVLKYLGGISMALLFSSVYCLLRLSDMRDGVPVSAPGALAILCLLVVGGALGVLFAEMIMRRSAHVLRMCWRDALVLAAVSVVFVGVCWFDVLGVAHYVPDAAKVEQAFIMSDYTDQATLEERENVSAVCDLQRDLLAYDVRRASGDNYVTINIIYQLSGGRLIKRSYPVLANYQSHYYDGTPKNEGSLLLDSFMQISDSREGRASRFAEVLDPEAQLTFQVEYCTDVNQYEYKTVTLTADEAADLRANALSRDLLEEPAGESNQNYVSYEENYLNATLYAYERGEDGVDYERCVMALQLGNKSTPNTLAWLAEHHPEIEFIGWDGELG